MNEHSLALGAPLTPKTFADFVQRLRHDCMGDGVKDHGTADAIFTVQAKRRVTGLDLELTDDWLIHFDGCEWTNPLDYWNELEKETQEALDADVREKHDCSFLELHLHDQFEFLGSLQDHTLTGYQEVWEYVNSHFTKDAAEAFIRRKKHDYRRGLRVYVEAQTYCWEFNAVKKGLMDGQLVLKDQQDELLKQRDMLLEAIEKIAKTEIDGGDISSAWTLISVKHLAQDMIEKVKGGAA